MFSDWGECNFKANLFDSADVFIRRAHGIAMRQDYKVEKARTTALLGMLSLCKYSSDRVANNSAYLEDAEKFIDIAKMIDSEYPNQKTQNLLNLGSIKLNYYKALIEKDQSRLSMYRDNVIALLPQAEQYALGSNDLATQQELMKIKCEVLISQGKIAKAKALADSIETSVVNDDKVPYSSMETFYYIKSKIAIAEGKYDEGTKYIDKAFMYNNSTSIDDKSLASSLQLAKLLNVGERERARGRENALKAQARMRNMILATIGIVLVSLIVVSVVIFRSLRRSKRLNKKISAQNEEIHSINEKVTRQNAEITGSINYAKLIQKAILPSKEKMDAIFGDHLFLFRAKDIVSGDFLWAYETARQKFIAVCDCTGHGVPGAMLSMLGSNILEHSTRRVSFQPKSAAEILDQCRIEFKKTLKQDKYTSDGAKDSIDMALLVYNKSSKILEFVGAMRPMWIIRNGEVIKLKSDPMPIGVYPKEKEHFSNQSVKLEENDYIYLFSDGIQDQFGWSADYPVSKTFSSQRFTQMLLKNYLLPFPEQKTNIKNELAEWMKGKQEGQQDCLQTDDNILIGLSVKNFY